TGVFGPSDHPRLRHDRTAAWLGLTVSEYGEGYATGHMQLRVEMLNGFEIAHGGILFACADTIFACAGNDPDGDGPTPAFAQGAGVKFVSSPTLGTKLTAIGNRRAKYGRSGIYDITIYDDQDQLVAEFRGRPRTIPNPKHEVRTVVETLSRRIRHDWPRCSTLP